MRNQNFRSLSQVSSDDGQYSAKCQLWWDPEEKSAGLAAGGVEDAHFMKIDHFFGKKIGLLLNPTQPQTDS